MAYQSINARKEEFRKYLEKNGVVDSITKGKHSTTFDSSSHTSWQLPSSCVIFPAKTTVPCFTGDRTAIADTAFSTHYLSFKIHKTNTNVICVN